MVEIRNQYRIPVEKHEGNRQIERPKVKKKGDV
jgi:hypothetical protein